MREDYSGRSKGKYDEAAYTEDSDSDGGKHDNRRRSSRLATPGKSTDDSKSRCVSWGKKSGKEGRGGGRICWELASNEALCSSRSAKRRRFADKQEWTMSERKRVQEGVLTFGRPCWKEIKVRRGLERRSLSEIRHAPLRQARFLE